MDKHTTKLEMRHSGGSLKLVDLHNIFILQQIYYWRAKRRIGEDEVVKMSLLIIGVLTTGKRGTTWVKQCLRVSSCPENAYETLKKAVVRRMDTIMDCDKHHRRNAPEKKLHFVVLLYGFQWSLPMTFYSSAVSIFSSKFLLQILNL